MRIYVKFTLSMYISTYITLNYNHPYFVRSVLLFSSPNFFLDEERKVNHIIVQKLADFDSLFQLWLKVLNLTSHANIPFTLYNNNKEEFTILYCHCTCTYIINSGGLGMEYLHGYSGCAELYFKKYLSKDFFLFARMCDAHITFQFCVSVNKMKKIKFLLQKNLTKYTEFFV